MKIKLYQAGYCTHPDYIVTGNFSFKIRKFPMICALIKHPKFGYILFDTGYNNHFFNATKKFPYSLYRHITPVNIPKTLKESLIEDGILPNEINYIIISHFHADHISALSDFPHATILCSQKGYEYARNSSVWKLRKGILPGLMQALNSRNIKFFESSPMKTNLKKIIMDGYDIFTDGSIIAYPLPGHAIGHYGALCNNTNKGNIFLVADAVWTTETISRIHRPHWLTAILHDSQKEYWESINKLRLWAEKYPDTHIVPSHCASAYEKIQENQHDQYSVSFF